MNKIFKISVLAGAMLLSAGAAQAGTVIYNTGSAATATVALGVNDNGSLNTTPNITSNAGATGLAYNIGTTTAPRWVDATAPGCLCEGWGVSVNGTVSGYANVANGTAGLTVGAVSGVSGNSVTTTTSLSSLPGLKITQTYQTSSKAPGVLFRDHVTITNTSGAAVSNVKYVRVMDWDINPHEFSEFVTIKGTASTTLLEESGANGFNTANPLALYSASGYACHDVDCTAVGPKDHGAYFRFNFGSINDGASYEFDIFYGAAGGKEAAISAIAAEGLELYSLGQSRSDSTPYVPQDNRPTYIFGFKGVGGTVLECGLPGQPPCVTTVPEPASIALLGLALAAMGFARRRYRKS